LLLVLHFFLTGTTLKQLVLLAELIPAYEWPIHRRTFDPPLYVSNTVKQCYSPVFDPAPGVRWFSFRGSM